jgi:hypothetical protein
MGFAWSLGPAADRRADRDDEASEFGRKDMVMECSGYSDDWQTSWLSRSISIPTF